MRKMPKTKKAKAAKMGKVMKEAKSGKLKSGSGKKVTNPKQAIAIGLKESGQSKAPAKKDSAMGSAKTARKKKLENVSF